MISFPFLLFTRFMQSKFEMIACRGQKKVGPCPDWSPLGVYFKICDKHPHPLNSYGIPLGVNNSQQPSGLSLSASNQPKKSEGLKAPNCLLHWIAKPTTNTSYLST